MSDHFGRMAIIFGVTLLVALALTPLVRKVALRRGLVDVPGEERRVHTLPVPRLGGLAMYAAFAIGVLLTFLLDVRNGQIGNARFESSRVLLLLLGAGIITLVMAVDDVRGIRPLPRLLWQIFAALAVIVPSLIWPGAANSPDEAARSVVHYDQGAGVLTITVQSPLGGTIELPLILGVLFTLVWLVGVTNTINWIDGLDGLAAGVTVVACAVLFIITGPVLKQYTLSYLPLVLGAATLGFLPYNLHPARIFMGDSGAMFLGFTLAIVSIIGGAKMAVALLVLGVPILDGAYLIVYRVYRGRSPMLADRGHLHHRLLDIGLTQQQVVMVFYLLTAGFGFVAYVFTAFTGILDARTVALLKFSALVVLVIVLAGILVFISRRRFDRTQL